MVRTRYGVGTATLVVAGAMLAGCAGYDERFWRERMPLEKRMGAGSVSTLNYTSHYIHGSAISGPDEIRGGGPNVLPVRPDGEPSGGGAETCCMTYPLVWRPQLRLTVRWLMDKAQDGKTPGYWYKAEDVTLPEYDGQRGQGVWVIFLPGDRVKVMVRDGHNPNRVWERPADDDPNVFHGVRDDEWNGRFRRGGTQ